MSVTLLGVDRATAPSLEELAAISGLRWVAGYIGGVNLAAQFRATWTNDIIASIRKTKLFLPIYVGQNLCQGCDGSKLNATQGKADGAGAVEAARGLDLPLGHPLCLDIEYATYQQASAATLAYLSAWTTTVRSLNYYPVVYGPPAMAGAVDSAIASRCGYWQAWWGEPVDLSKIAGPWRGRGWQYSDAFNGFDASLADGLWWSAMTVSAGSELRADGSRWFSETGHTINHGFRAFWEQFGGLEIFGYPISEEFKQDNLTVQYFERAVFEWHPGSNAQRYDVELRRLGSEVASQIPADAAKRVG